MTADNTCNPFVFGAHIYRVPSLPIQELKQDIRTLKELGFNTVKLQVSWSIVEQQEEEIDLGEVEELITEARSVGIKVYLGITMEQVPMWAWRKYPDCRLVNGVGQPHNDPTQYLLPADGKPGPCWDHPGIRQEADRFLSTLTQRLCQYENIVVWHVWQEIGFWRRQAGISLAEGSYCYCPFTLDRFRDWLKQKYKRLQALNITWCTGFGNWDEVEPPRKFAMVPAWIDWRYFMDVVYLAGVVKQRADVLRKNDPMGRPVMAHVDAPTLGAGRDWAYAKELDVFGTSFYPGWLTLADREQGFAVPESLNQEAHMHQSLWRFSLHFDYIRSTSVQKTVWAGEFQGGPFNTGIYRGPDPTPKDIRRWLMIALAGGVQGICFWNHRPDIFWSEMHGYGLCEWDGTATDRAKEAGRIGQAINRHPDLFRSGRTPQAQVAIVVSEDLYHFAEATPDALKHLQHTLKGWYQCLWEKGVWVDFVEADQVLQGHLEPYLAAIMPFPVALGDELAKALKEYVSVGGTLISDAGSGRVNEYGLANLPGMAPAMQELFGVEHESLNLCQPWGTPLWATHENVYGQILPPTLLKGTGPYQGYATRASLYVETYRPTGGTPILLSEQGVTGVINTCGQGKGILLGTLMGHAVATYDHAQSRDFMLKLLTDAGIKPERCGRLSRRCRVSENKQAWFLINDSDRPITERVDVTGFTHVQDLLEEKALDVKRGTTTITVEPFEFRCLVLNR